MAENSGYILPDAGCLLPRSGRIAKDTLQLSLRLSKLAYDMDIAPYLDAGWQDISFQVDDLLLTDFKSRKSILQAAAKAKSRMEKLDPISQYRGFKRQKEELDTCKAVVLSKQTGDITLIVIAFTGTTRRMYEWLGNLRVEEEDGFHAGFLQLTKVFEENAGKITFPSIQKTLANVIDEMRAGSSRYRLFVTGHSQGAALTQIYLYRLMQSGVPAEKMQGVGFASPCVCMERSVQLAANYPIIHVINADDVIARIGGRMHIGMCHVLPPSGDFRRACYGPRADLPVMREMLALLHDVRSTPQALLLGMALTESLAQLPASESEEIWGAVMRSYLPDVFVQRLRGYAQRIMRSANRRLQMKYEKTAGAVKTEELAVYRGKWADCIANFGAKESIAALMDVLARPHALAESGHTRAYQLLTEEFDRQLVSCMWCNTGDPVWDQWTEIPKGREMRAAYDRFHPLSTQRRRKRDDQ